MTTPIRPTAAILSLFFALPACARMDAPEAAASVPSAAASAPPAPAPEEPTASRIQVPASLERSCREICDRTRKLNCDNLTKCMPNCLAMGSLTPCSKEITDLYGCLVGQPVQNWQCEADGVAAIKPGFCDNEQEASLACMEAKMR